MALEPALIVLADYGQIVPPALLELRHGALNLHPSLLPRHRGATPIPAAILAGDETTGVSLMRMDDGLDTGPIVAQAPVPLGPDETAPELEARPRRARSRQLLRDVSLGRLAARRDPAEPQPDEGATLTRAAAARGRPARPGPVRRRARAPGPRVPAVARLVPRHAARSARRLAGGGGRDASTARGSLRAARSRDRRTASCALDEVQPAGGKRMAWGAFLPRPRPGIARQRCASIERVTRDARPGLSGPHPRSALSAGWRRAASPPIARARSPTPVWSGSVASDRRVATLPAALRAGLEAEFRSTPSPTPS